MLLNLRFILRYTVLIFISGIERVVVTYQTTQLSLIDTELRELTTQQTKIISLLSKEIT